MSVAEHLNATSSPWYATSDVGFEVIEGFSRVVS